jgi:hypothetical protein
MPLGDNIQMLGEITEEGLSRWPPVDILLDKVPNGESRKTSPPRSYVELLKG